MRSRGMMKLFLRAPWFLVALCGLAAFAFLAAAGAAIGAAVLSALSAAALAGFAWAARSYALKRRRVRVRADARPDRTLPPRA